MRLAELARRFSLAAGYAQHVTVEVELQQSSGVPVRKPEVLVRIDEQAARRSGMLGFPEIRAVRIEHLDALVVAVSHVQQPLGVDRDRMRDVELSRTGALLAPRLDEVAVLVELDDLGLAASMALDHEDIALRPERHVVGLVEQPQMAVGMHLACGVAYSEHEQDASLGAELVDDMGARVGGPDIVLRVDPQPVRPVEQAVAQGAQEFAIGVELHERIRAAMQHENVPLGADGHARGAAEGHAGGQAEAVGDHDVVERRGRGGLRDGRYGHQRAHQQDRNASDGCHISGPYVSVAHVNEMPATRQSPLMPAVLITRSHFSNSTLMYRARSSGSL